MVIRVRIRWCTAASSVAARAPTDGAEPVNDSSSATQRCAGMKCTTIR
jgi:hypothetical protein